MPAQPVCAASLRCGSSIRPCSSVIRAYAATRRSIAASVLATDADFTAGRDPVVEGPLLSLVMAMAGRPAFLPDLHGDGVPVLRRRLGQASTGA
jgi:hypothetical protein